MKKEKMRQTFKGKRILGRILAKEFGDDEMKLVTGGREPFHDGPTTAAVTGMGYEDN